MAKDAKPEKAAKSPKSAKGGDPGAVGLWTQRSRGIGLLLGFGITYWISRGEGLPTSDAILRGVVGAIAMSLVCWWCALLVIQALMRTAVSRQNEDLVAAQIAATRDEEPDESEGQR